MADLKTNLVADLKDILLAALDMGDYAKVKKLAGYLEELTAEKAAAPAKRGRRPKAAKTAEVAKVPKKRGRPAKAKTVTEVAVEVEKEKKPAKVVKKTKASKKAPRVKEANAPKAEPAAEMTAEVPQE